MRALSILPTLTLALAFSVLGHGALAQTTGNSSELRQQALELVNADRAENDLPRLALDPALVEAAQAHAADMEQRRYYSHNSPEGEDVQDRFVEAGGSQWVVVAENIARCTNCETTPTPGAVDRLEEGWMNSPEHRANILGHGLTLFGFGIASNPDGRLYAVQTFAGPGTPRGVDSAEETSVVAPEQVTAMALDAINAERESAGVAPLEVSDALVVLAGEIIPESFSEPFSLDQLGGLAETAGTALPGQWQQLSQLAAACGGCGTEPTAADIAFFVGDWLDGAQSRQSLLSPDFAEVGQALEANGEGRKVAVIVLGAAR